jgi:hypothetical protein
MFALPAIIFGVFFGSAKNDRYLEIARDHHLCGMAVKKFGKRQNKFKTTRLYRVETLQQRAGATPLTDGCIPVRESKFKTR